jgi:DNA-binding CsgD family transcriptional regulator
MRSSRLPNKAKQVGEANNGGANLHTTRLANGCGTGFLLLDAALKPLYVNAEAGEILFHAEKPTKAKDFADRLASKIHTIVANGGSNGRISVYNEFVSGSRRYVCRLFGVGLPGNGSNGSKGSSWALLLERDPKAAADILKICHQYHLSQREGEAVRFLVEGLTSKVIATRMKISPNTVKVFLRLAMMKMGVSSRSGIMSKFIHLKADVGVNSPSSRVPSQ